MLFLKEANLFKELPKELEEVNTIKKAMEVLGHMSLREEERDAYEARLGWLMDEELVLEKDEKKGIKKGRIKEKIVIARNLINQKIDIETILVVTGLTIDEINKLI